MDEYFSGSKPDLINRKTLGKFDNMLKVSEFPEKTNVWTNIYEDYLKQNLFFFIILILLVLFLLYRYLTKEPKKTDLTKEPEEKEEITEDFDDVTEFPEEIIVENLDKNINQKRDIDLMAQVLFNNNNNENNIECTSFYSPINFS